MKDAESGAEVWVDTSSRRTRETYNKWWVDSSQKSVDMFNKSRVDTVSISTDEDFVPALLNLFKRRGN
jgi:hypothetical protein